MLPGVIGLVVATEPIAVVATSAAAETRLALLIVNQNYIETS